MSMRRHLLLIVGLLIMAAPVGIGQVNTVKPGEPVERHLSSDQAMKEWAHGSNRTDDIKRIKVCRVENVCKMRYKEGQTPRTRVKNLVMPMRYEDEHVTISGAFTKQLQQALNNLRDKQGVTIRFIGYTDDAPLTGRDESLYGNQMSLSKARAQRVALAMQKILGLPASAIESDGRGASHPIASNTTEQGRTMNRRIEVEFWYDDPLQDLPDQAQLCPDDIEETVARVYDPAWGSIPDIKLENGQLIIPPDYATNLHRALADIADRTNARLRFIGYTRNEVLDRRTASVPGPNMRDAATSSPMTL
jgi:outer membrane protein OmpA-like peptidoglycan-associated protein